MLFLFLLVLVSSPCIFAENVNGDFNIDDASANSLDCVDFNYELSDNNLESADLTKGSSDNNLILDDIDNATDNMASCEARNSAGAVSKISSVDDASISGAVSKISSVDDASIGDVAEHTLVADGSGIKDKLTPLDPVYAIPIPEGNSNTQGDNRLPILQGGELLIQKLRGSQFDITFVDITKVYVKKRMHKQIEVNDLKIRVTDKNGNGVSNFIIFAGYHHGNEDTLSIHDFTMSYIITDEDGYATYSLPFAVNRSLDTEYLFYLPGYPEVNLAGGFGTPRSWNLLLD